VADLGQHIGTVARELLGEPNKRLSSAHELRFGSNGSLAVDLKHGRWFSHEDDAGGNVVELIERYGGVKNGGVKQWLADRGIGDEPQARQPAGRKEIEATYDYTDESGELLFQAVRFRFVDAGGKPLLKDGKPRKAFSQRTPAGAGGQPPAGAGGWQWSLKGVRLVPYGLPELQEALAEERTIFIAEGEKKVDRLRDMGIPATCNPMGAGKWPEGFAEIFRGANVVILPDNDDAGRNHANLVGASLSPVAESVKVLGLPGLPAKGDVIEWADAGGTAEQLYDLAERFARPWAPAPPALHFGAVWFAESETALADPEWLVDDLLTTGDVSLVYGPSQSGKSFLATHLALAIARGVEVFGRKTRLGGVAYVAAEGKKGFKKRLKAYRKANEIPDAAAVPFLLIPTAVDLYAKDGDAETLCEDLKAAAPLFDAMGAPLCMVVLDTLAACSPGANENASEDMSRIIRNCRLIQEETNGHVMIVHHKNAAGDRPRGHTSLYAGSDNAIEVSCDDFKNRNAHVAKLKDGEDGGNIGFRLQSVTIGVRDDGKPITSCVVVPSEAGVARTSEKKRRLTPQTLVALSALRYALAEYGEPAPGVLELPHGIRVVHYRYWADRFSSTSFEGEDSKPDAVKKALQRAGTQLLAANVISRNQPYVWIVREPEGAP